MDGPGKVGFLVRTTSFSTVSRFTLTPQGISFYKFLKYYRSRLIIWYVPLEDSHPETHTDVSNIRVFRLGWDTVVRFPLLSPQMSLTPSQSPPGLVPDPYTILYRLLS